MKIPPPPPGFVTVEEEGDRCVGFARAGVADVVRDAVARHGTLHEASQRWPDPLALAGRGRLVAARPPGVAASPPGEESGGEASRWVVRPYLRGGWMAPLLGDRHLAAGTPRPWVEARAGAALEAAGVATARVVAGVVYPGWPWYRAELVTEYIADTRDLAGLLFGGERIAEGEPRAALLAAAARIPDALAAAGVLHRDLNAKNLLARCPDGTSPASRPDLHVIDLDRARVGRVSPGEARAMATRLARSLDKFGHRRGPPLSEPEWAAFRTPPPTDERSPT